MLWRFFSWHEWKELLYLFCFRPSCTIIEIMINLDASAIVALSFVDSLMETAMKEKRDGVIEQSGEGIGEYGLRPPHKRCLKQRSISYIRAYVLLLIYNQN